MKIFAVNSLLPQSFTSLEQRPLCVDLTVEEGQRLKVVYGSNRGFHAIDLDTSQVFDIYIPSHVSVQYGSGVGVGVGCPQNGMVYRCVWYSMVHYGICLLLNGPLWNMFVSHNRQNLFVSFEKLSF